MNRRRDPSIVQDVIKYAREEFVNDGAEGETVHFLCDQLEYALADLQKLRSPKWTSEWPSEPGQYLFCARLKHIVEPPRLMLVRAHQGANAIMYSCGGMMIYRSEWEGVWSPEPFSVEMPPELAPKEATYTLGSGAHPEQEAVLAYQPLRETEGDLELVIDKPRKGEP